MKVRIGVSELVTRQESFQRARRMMELQMRQASKTSEMIQRAWAETGFLVEADERPYGDIDHPDPF